MRKIIASLLLIFLCIFIIGSPVYASEPTVHASAAILLDAKTGEILYAKNAYVPRAPASTTKIMTALLAIERGQLDDIVTVSTKAAAVGEASLHLSPGDKLTMRDLLHGALLKSGNDACVALAEAICSSEEEFVNLMNLKARVLGAENTNFYNTNGLPHKDHLTTAYDLALMARYAMSNKDFAEIVGKKEYTIQWLEPKRILKIKNTNQLLHSYEWITGVKTGTTNKAGKCLVASGSYQGREMIVVILNSGDRFGEAKRLLEYGLRGEGA